MMASRAPLMALSIVPPSPPPELPSLEELLEQDEGAYLGVEVAARRATIIGELQPDDYLHMHSGCVAVFDSGGDKLAELGRWSVTLVDVESAVADGMSVFDVFDHSSATIDYYDLFEPTGWSFKEGVLKTLDCDGESVPCGLLVVDRLELLPKYRGQDVGLRAMEFLIAHFRMGAGMVAIKPFPLQFEGDVRDEPHTLRYRGLDRYPASEVVCMRKLVRHYGRIGFQRVPRTPFMCLPLIRGFQPRP